MLFYEKLRNDNYSTIPVDQRQFQDPKAFLKRIEKLTESEKLSEMTYLVAILAEKI
jgi:hypothetical protein